MVFSTDTNAWGVHLLTQLDLPASTLRSFRGMLAVLV